MVPAVVLVLALAASGLSLPLTTQTGQIENETIQQTLTEVPVAQFVEKTGSESSSQVYSQVGQVQAVPKVENIPVNVEQQQVSNSENPVLLPVQPLSVVPAAEVPQVLRPVIVPAEAITSGRVIIAGIESIQQRNFPQDEVVSVEPYQQVVNPVTYTQVQPQQVQPGQQAYFVQPQTVQQEVAPAGQEYVPLQVQPNQQPLVKEQAVPVNVIPENVEQVQNYNTAPVESNPQVYAVPQNVQEVVVQSPENVPYHVGSGYVPVQTVQQPVQQIVEKQLPYQQSYNPAQTQGVVPENHQYQPYTGTPVVVESVEKQVPQQQSPEYQQQVYNIQQAEKHGEYQQVSTHTPVQNQQVTQQVYDAQQVIEKQGQYQVQSVEPQQQQVQTVQQGVENQVPVQRSQPVEQVHQQVYSAQPIVQNQPLQTNPQESLSQQQVYNVQPVAQKQPVEILPEESVSQQQVYNVQPVVQNQPVQTLPEEAISQQQVYSVQPVAVDQTVSEVPYHQSVQQQTAEYIPEVGSKSSEVEQQQQQQAVNYATASSYNFGDKIPQQQSQFHTLSGVPQTQGTSVQSSVVSSQK